MSEENVAVETKEPETVIKTPAEPAIPTMDELLGDELAIPTDEPSFDTANPTGADKALGKVQQRMEAQDRQFEQLQGQVGEISSNIGRLADKLESQGAAPQEVQQVQKVNHELDAIKEELAQLGSEDGISQKQSSALMRRMVRLIENQENQPAPANSSNNDVNEQVAKQISDMKDSVAQQQHALAVQQYEASWNAKHSHIQGRMQQFIDKATDNIRKDFPHAHGAHQVGLVDGETVRLSKIGNAKAKELADVQGKAPSRKSPESTAGVNVVKDGTIAPANNDGVQRDRNGLPVGMENMFD